MTMHSSELRQAIVMALAPSAAVFVFGVIYGSLAKPELGVAATVLSSLLIFSGSVQFTLVALLTSGAGATALLAGAATLNVRNLVLGAVMRPRLEGSTFDRAARSWFLTDEAVGLAIVSGADASRVLVVSGVMLYLTWQTGTLLGILGASIDGLANLAASVFPVLFIGLAALSCTSRSIAVRAVAAAGIAALASWLWPGSEAVVAVVAAVAVAVPERRR